jgi:hypothetical protein
MMIKSLMLQQKVGDMLRLNSGGDYAASESSASGYVTVSDTSGNCHPGREPVILDEKSHRAQVGLGVNDSFSMRNLLCLSATGQHQINTDGGLPDMGEKYASRQDAKGQDLAEHVPQEYKTGLQLPSKQDAMSSDMLPTIESYKERLLAVSNPPPYEASSGCDDRMYTGNLSGNLDNIGIVYSTCNFHGDNSSAYKSKIDTNTKSDPRIYTSFQTNWLGGNPDNEKCDETMGSTSSAAMTAHVDAKTSSLLATPASAPDYLYSKNGYMYSTGYMYGDNGDVYTAVPRRSPNLCELPAYNSQYHILSNVPPITPPLYPAVQTTPLSNSPLAASTNLYHQEALSRSHVPESDSEAYKHQLPLPAWTQNAQGRRMCSQNSSPEIEDAKLPDIMSDDSITSHDDITSRDDNEKADKSKG